MKSYLISWEIDLHADSPREAAEKAFEIQRDPASEALFFEVIEHGTNEHINVDLMEEDETGLD